MAIDLTGQIFGRLTAMERAETRYFDVAIMGQWKCVCDCGREVTVITSNLTSGNTKSCGCLQAEARSRSGKAKFRHGAVGTPTWTSWHSMKQRCLDPKHQQY